jgi:cation:H+ antiporter
VENIIGSMAFFTTANVGVIALVKPLDAGRSLVTIRWPFLLWTLAAVIVLFVRGRVTRTDRRSPPKLRR